MAEMPEVPKPLSAAAMEELARPSTTVLAEMETEGWSMAEMSMLVVHTTSRPEPLELAPSPKKTAKWMVLMSTAATLLVVPPKRGLL